MELLTRRARHKGDARRQFALDVVSGLSVSKVIASFEEPDQVMAVHHKWCPLFDTGVCGCAPLDPVFVMPPARV